MEPPDSRVERECMLVRVINRESVCVILRETQAVVLAELRRPLSPRSHVNAQLVHAFNQVPAIVRLGPYDVQQHRFTGCSMEAQLPEASYNRLAYAARQESKKRS